MMSQKLQSMFVAAALLAVIGSLSEVSAQSESMAFRCSEPRGWVYYGPGSLTPPASQGWRESSIRGGEFLILVGPENGEGGADVRFRDGTGILQSHKARGAKVYFLGSTPTSLRVDVLLNDLNTETFVVTDIDQAHPQLIWTQVRGGGLIISAQTLVARCDKI